MTNAISSDLAKALELWKQLTKVSSNMKISDWYLSQTFSELDESLTLDPTEITTNLLLTSFLNGYLKNSNVCLYDLLMGSPTISEDLKTTKEILAIVQRPDIIEIRDYFINTLKDAMNTYGDINRADISKLLNTYDRIAILRRDALRSIAKLKTDQFISGDHDPENVNPVYVRVVNRWKNINSLITALPHMPSGVSLNLISPPDYPSRSFFCFGIRNGGNIFILSDSPTDEHPMQRHMTRRPDRHLESRMSKNWFPYELLDLKYDEDDNLIIKDDIQGLIPYHSTAYAIKAISDLDSNSFAWTSMMFDLIVDKFWRKKFNSEELSYTSEMINTHDRFVESTAAANLPVATYNPIELKPLTYLDVTSDNLDKAGIKRQGSGKNKWLEERYGHLVPESSLNAIASHSKRLLLDHRSSQITEADKASESSPWGLASNEYVPIKLDTMDPSDFGSRAQIDADRRFIARSNFAACIGRYANDEYKARKDEVFNWYSNKVKDNIIYLLSLINHNELWVDVGVHGCFSNFENGAGKHVSFDVEPGAFHSASHEYHTFLRTEDRTDKDHQYSIFSTDIRFGGYTSAGHNTCYVNNTKASYTVIFTPATQYELAVVAGCQVEELPDVLQTWNLYKPYEGNHLLDRIDPLEWKIKNPWMSLKLSVAIHLSKRAMTILNKYEKSYPVIPGLLKDIPWKKK